MRPGSRFLLATLAGLILGAIIHLVVVLSMPGFSERDTFSQLMRNPDDDAPGFIFSPANESGLPWLRYVDPAVTLAVCPYDLDTGPYIMTIRGDVSFQSISFHAHQGNVYFAVTDKAQVRGQSSFVVATEAQMMQLMQSGEYDEFYSRNIKVTAPSSKGLAVLRTLAPYPSFKKISEDISALADCHRLTSEDQPQTSENNNEEDNSHDLLPPRRGGR